MNAEVIILHYLFNSEAAIVIIIIIFEFLRKIKTTALNNIYRANENTGEMGWNRFFGVYDYGAHLHRVPTELLPLSRVYGRFVFSNFWLC